jgi:hypothetical protein
LRITGLRGKGGGAAIGLLGYTTPSCETQGGVFILDGLLIRLYPGPVQRLLRETKGATYDPHSHLSIPCMPQWKKSSIHSFSLLVLFDCF